MTFVCLLYVRSEAFAGMSEAENDQMQRDTFAYDTTLEAEGRLIFARPLEAPRQAITLRTRDGKLSATDGPFAETTEHLGGFMVIEARDMDEARAIAEADPMLRYATFESRPALDVRDEIAARHASRDADRADAGPASRR